MKKSDVKYTNKPYAHTKNTQTKYKPNNSVIKSPNLTTRNGLTCQTRFDFVKLVSLFSLTQLSLAFKMKVEKSDKLSANQSQTYICLYKSTYALC